MAAIPILLIAAFLIFLFVLFLKSTRASLIQTIDDRGLTTKSGKFFQWSDLERIEMNLLQHRVNPQKKVQSVHFYFKTGKASAGYLMPIIQAAIEKANQMQVPKSEKVVGLYVR